MNKLKHDNFVRISSNRKEKILSTLDQLGNLDNFSYYEFEEEEINKIFKELENKAIETKKKLVRSIKNKNKKDFM